MDLGALSRKVKSLGVNRVARESGLGSKVVVYRVLRGQNTETESVVKLAHAAKASVHVLFLNRYSLHELESVLSSRGMPVFAKGHESFSGVLTLVDVTSDHVGLIVGLIDHARREPNLATVVPYFFATQVNLFDLLRAFEYLDSEGQRVLGYFVSLAAEFLGTSEFRSVEEHLLALCLRGREGVAELPLFVHDRSLLAKFPRAFSEKDRHLSKWKLIATTSADDHLRRFKKWKEMGYGQLQAR